jgi:hypothetical protein
MTLALGAAAPATAPARAHESSDRRGGDNIVIRWNQAGLDAVINSRLGPPMVARALAVLHTCIYDAWAAYDPWAAGTQLGTRLRQPFWERTARNKDEAISWAAYTAAVDIWPELAPRFDTLMASLGYSTPQSKRARAVGVRACRAVLDYRHRDGSNQLGDLAEGPYSDYTAYKPVNEPTRVDGVLDPSTVKDPSRWQPLIYTDQNGEEKLQAYLGPHMGNVKPFAMRSWDQFELPPPARYGSRAYVKQARELINYAANLTDRQKVITEYWADEGPGFVSPPGTWSRISQFVSRRDRHNVDQDAKMFFAVNNAIFDASIGIWGMKRHFDYVRPVTAIRYLYHGKRILSWPKAGERPKKIDGAKWWPYQPSFFATPAFAEYPSGHAGFGAAAAEVLKLFTGSDRYGDSVVLRAGTSRVEPGISPRRDVRLSWRTFTAAAVENGISREYGGLHFRDGDVHGLSLGRKAGASTFAKSAQLFAGIAVPPID